MPESLPYKIAVLCYLFDAAGRVLLLHRRKPPNRDLFSPVGGKLEQATGESPTACAVREILEETGLGVDAADLHLTGIISENDFNDDTHWLMFLYELTRPVDLAEGSFDEGKLEWHERERLPLLPLPDTDRYVIWPMFWKYRGRFFMVHIDCRGGELRWRVEQPAGDAQAPCGHLPTRKST